MAKKKYIFFLIIFILILAVFLKSNIKIGTTILNNILVDSIKIGSSLDELDLSGYNLSNKFFNEDNTIHYDKLSITFNEYNIITKISYNLFNNNQLVINGINNITNIKDVINILGKEYKYKWYDKQQKLRQIIYIDINNYLKVKFIFDDITGNLVKFIIIKIYYYK